MCVQWAPGSPLIPSSSYRGVSFRKVGVNLGKVSDSYDYLKIIADATAGAW